MHITVVIHKSAFLAAFGRGHVVGQQAIERYWNPGVRHRGGRWRWGQSGVGEIRLCSQDGE